MSDDRYLVWAFRHNQSCYDCGSTERIEAEPNASAVQLNEEDFSAFLRAANNIRSSEFVYLYRKQGDNAMPETIMKLVELGRVELEQEKERTRIRAEKAAEKAAKSQSAAAKKEIEERKKKKKLYEQLKAEFEQ